MCAPPGRADHRRIWLFGHAPDSAHIRVRGRAIKLRAPGRGSPVGIQLFS